ncbi:reverse transcriptase-like protein [Elysia marginata]|uniref:Reverse transcriptase-like protein n=1 Tax=Elysia marginata TaxID=1093978 RepID=A0AAV4FK22_9GAST|nr:reverse transcriptase-like protein [Elysia marginata]
MNSNKLKLNDDKTEILLMKSGRQTINTPSVSINHNTIDMAEKAKNLEVIFDSDFSMQHQLSTLCKSLYFQLRKIGSIREYPTEKVAKTHVTSLILSKFDYCNSTLAGCLQNKLQKLQSIMNNSARLLCRKPKTTHVTQLLRFLHWLPVKQRLTTKLQSCVSNLFTVQASTIIPVRSPRDPPITKCLRSPKDTNMLKVLRVNVKTYGERSFSYIGPVTLAQNSHVSEAVPNTGYLKKETKNFPVSELLNLCRLSSPTD